MSKVDEVIALTDDLKQFEISYQKGAEKCICKASKIKPVPWEILEKEDQDKDKGMVVVKLNKDFVSDLNSTKLASVVNLYIADKYHTKYFRSARVILGNRSGLITNRNDIQVRPITGPLVASISTGKCGCNSLQLDIYRALLPTL